jgi:predicted nucleic acid-binding Zn ribbon protein
MVEKMEKCIYCAEEIQNDAIKCKFCGKILSLNQLIKMIHLWKVIILWAGTFAIIAMCFFPPWSEDGTFVGYAYMFSDGIFHKYFDFHAHIDIVRLIIQIIIAGLITGVLFYTLSNKKATEGGK